ncbi:hypothetical protein PCANC_22390 [Puccinia coronata f. sp. avenae]|uniref:Reverse transcriptase domain-containing protein n=1 Tax=Puccinia coronata f. sp. avenae TaxID=200324 RepID=A0A2N5TKL3_9BASI|nr:hypothetical protein PCANC_22390 [Puccinia coronata f. sp. avenae]
MASFLLNKTEPVKLGIFDWEKAYHQIPTAPDNWPYLMTKDFQGNLLLETRIAFSGVAGYNNLFVKEIEGKLEMKTIFQHSNELGVETNKEKGVKFQTDQKYIGFFWKGDRKTVRLPSSKLQERIQQVQDILLPSSKFSSNQIKITTGHLNHVSYVLPQLRCYLNSLYQTLCSWKDKEALRAIPDKVCCGTTDQSE